MMYAGDYVVTLMLVIYLNYFWSLRKKSNREMIAKTNDELDKLRMIEHKTIEEQKRFLDIRFPHTKFKFSLSFVWSFVGNIVLFILVYRGVNFLFNEMHYHFGFFECLAFLIITPIVMHIVLRKLGVGRPSMLNVLFK